MKNYVYDNGEYMMGTTSDLIKYLKLCLEDDIFEETEEAYIKAKDLIDRLEQAELAGFNIALIDKDGDNEYYFNESDKMSW